LESIRGCPPTLIIVVNDVERGSVNSETAEEAAPVSITLIGLSAVDSYPSLVLVDGKV
jgi:hypothetical protein